MKKFILLTLLSIFAMLVKAQPDYVSMEPENNSTVGSLTTVTFSFDTSVVTDIYTNSTQGQKWPVYDASGKQVAGAYLCEADQQNMIVVLKIQPSIYKAGTYKVTVPSSGLQIFDTADQRIAHDDWPLTFTVDGTETEPVINAHFTPEPESTVDYLAQITFTADGYSTYLFDNESSDKIQVVDESGKVVATGMPQANYGDDNGENAYGIINLSNVITDDGDYMVRIPSTIFRLGFDWSTCYQGNYDMLPKQELIYTVHNTSSTKYEVSYGQTSCINEIDVVFPEHETVTLGENVLSYDVKNSAGYWRGYTCTWDSLITTEGNKLNLKLNTGIYTPDTYTIFIPAGDLTFEDGSINTPLTINFTVKEAAATNVQTSPAMNSEVNEIYEMDVIFPDSKSISAYYDNPTLPLLTERGDTLLDAEGNDYYFALDKVTANSAKLRLLCGDDYVTLTTPGKYHFVLPYGSFYLNDEQTEVSSEITIPFTVVKNEDSHEYVNWGYYSGNDVTSLSSLGGAGSYYRVAIFLPGDGLLQNATLSGARIPVRSGLYVSALSAWVATNLKDQSTYSHQVEANNFHDGFNTIRFDENITIPAEGLYLGYDITINENYADYGALDAVIPFDEDEKTENALWMAVPGYAWYDYGPTWGSSALQGIFADLDISRPTAKFSSINNGSTQAGATSDWKFPVTVTNNETVTSIEYTIDIAGKSETRTAVANIPSGINQKGYVTVSITAPEEAGDYEVALKANKINGKENVQPTTTTSTFSNVAYSVTRHTVVEELTGNGCGWCPRGIVGLQKLNDTFGDKVICLASHQYNDSDPMYLPYINFADYGASSAPNCLIDRKTKADPYTGIKDEGSIIDDVQTYLNIPAVADVKLQARWTDTSLSAVEFETTVESFSPDTYEVAYVLTADNLGEESKTWAQSNYYASYDASSYPEELALFCKNGEYGTSAFLKPFNDVVIASSYNEYVNASGAQWSLADGQTQKHSYQMSLPTGTLGDAVRNQLDKVYAVAIVLNSKGEVAQAIKVNVSEIDPAGVEEISADDTSTDSMYDLQGRKIVAPQKGQIVIKNGIKILK